MSGIISCNLVKLAHQELVHKYSSKVFDNLMCPADIIPCYSHSCVSTTMQTLDQLSQLKYKEECQVYTEAISTNRHGKVVNKKMLKFD